MSAAPDPGAQGHPRLVRFRAMTPGDLAGVAAVERASYQFPWSEGIFRDCLRVGYLCRVADLDGEIVAYGVVAMGAGEGLVFIAEQDDEGRSLDGGCDYALTGEAPTARLWTLTVSDLAGRLPRAASGRTFLTSREILRDIDGRFEIAVSAGARPGNWLPAPAEGALRLVLRLYDTPLALSPGADMVMPHIERRGCR